MLNLNIYLVRERVGWLKMSDVYDLFDPATGTQVGICIEEPPGWVKLAKFLVNKMMLPTSVRVLEGADQTGRTLAVLTKGFTFIGASARVMDGNRRLLGSLSRSGFSLRRYFQILGPDGVEMACVKGDWKGWNFAVSDPSGVVWGTITKKWAGIGKELFTSADNYVVDLQGTTSIPERKILVLCTALAIDVLFKERG